MDANKETAARREAIDTAMENAQKFLDWFEAGGGVPGGLSAAIIVKEFIEQRTQARANGAKGGRPMTATPKPSTVRARRRRGQQWRMEREKNDNVMVERGDLRYFGKFRTLEEAANNFAADTSLASNDVEICVATHLDVNVSIKFEA